MQQDNPRMKLEARVVPLQDGGAEVLLPLELVLDEPVADAAGVEVLYRDALLLRDHSQQIQRRYLRNAQNK